jgi:hypothetical protein
MGKAAAVRLKLAKVRDNGADGANRRVKDQQEQRSETVNEKPESHTGRNTSERRKLRS